MQFKFSMHIHRVDQNKSTSKQYGISIHRRSQGVSKTFRTVTYKVHRMVIFAIAQLSCLLAGCPSCRPTSSFKALKAVNMKRETYHGGRWAPRCGHRSQSAGSRSWLRILRFVFHRHAAETSGWHGRLARPTAYMSRPHDQMPTAVQLARCTLMQMHCLHTLHYKLFYFSGLSW